MKRFASMFFVFFLILQLPLSAYGQVEPAAENLSDQISTSDGSILPSADLDLPSFGYPVTPPTPLPPSLPTLPPVSHAKPQQSHHERRHAEVKKGNFSAAELDRDSSDPETQSIIMSHGVEYFEGRVIIRLRSFADIDPVKNHFEQLGNFVQVLNTTIEPILLIESSSSGADAHELLRLSRNLPEVIEVEPDIAYETEALPNDPSISNQWYLDNAGIDPLGNAGTLGEDLQSSDAWDIDTGVGSAVIAVIDSGVMLNHPDLQGRLWDGSSCKDENGIAVSGGCPHHGFDYFDLDNNPSDEGTHGTEVAGIASAEGNNGIGISGVNQHGTIMALKAGTAGNTRLSTAAIISSIYFAVYNGAKIINASFSSAVESAGIKTALAFARDNGVLVVTAAGNASLNLDLPGNDAYPCETNLTNIFCVAATNVRGDLEFLGTGGVTSNYGAIGVDLAAPGTSMHTTKPVNTTLYSNTFDTLSSTNDFALAGGSDWGWSSGILKSHISGTYTNNEYFPASLNQNFDLSQVGSAALQFELSCSTDDTLDSNGNAVDGISVEFSPDGGLNYYQMATYNGLLADARAIYGTGPSGLPLITVGLVDQFFTSQFTFRLTFFSDTQLTGTGCIIDNIQLDATTAGSYVTVSGTSFAVPVVSGLASLLWDFKPSLTFSQVTDLLMTTGDVTAGVTGKVRSNQRVNAYRALATLTDPAPQSLLAFKTQGGTPFISGDSINSGAPYFTWSAPTGQGVMAGYSYALDANPDAAVDTTNLFIQLPTLTEGLHTLNIIGINDVGTTSAVTSFPFTIQTIVNAPTNLVINSGNIINASQQSAVNVTGNVSDAGTLLAQFSDGSQTISNPVALLVPGAFSFGNNDVNSLHDGALTVGFSFTDLLGNVATVGPLTIQKDTQVSSALNASLNNAVSINATTQTSVDLKFTVAESGSADYSIDDGVNPAIISSVVVLSSGLQTVNALDVSGLNDGVLNVSVVFTDTAGNVSLITHFVAIKNTFVVSVGGTSTIGRSKRSKEQLSLNAGLFPNIGADTPPQIEGAVTSAIQTVDNTSNAHIASPGILSHDNPDAGTPSPQSEELIITFPEDSLNLAEALTLLYRFGNVSVFSETSSLSYPGVPDDRWYSALLKDAISRGFVTTTEHQSVVPWRILNRAEVLKLTYEVFDIHPQDNSSLFSTVNDYWFHPYLVDAFTREIIDPPTASKEALISYLIQPMTRGDLLLLLKGLLQSTR